MSPICVLDTPDRARFDAACSLLRHEGIPFELRETRGGIVPYFTQDELRIFVSAAQAREAAELLVLLDEPAYPARQPYRDPEIEMPVDDEDEEEEAEAPSRKGTRAVVLLALAALAVAVVTIGLALAVRERFAVRAQPRVTPQSFEYGATSSRAFRGR